MGGNFSSNLAKATQAVRNVNDQTCAPTTGVTQAVVTPDLYVDNCKVKINASNNSQISTTCDMKSYATALGNLAQSLTTAQKVGLGLNMASNQAELNQLVENKLRQLCAPASIQNQFIGRDPTLIDPGTRISCETGADCMYPMNEDDAYRRNFGACLNKQCTGAGLPPNVVYCKNKGDLDLSYVNNANATTACVMLAVQNATAVAEQDSAIEQSGMNIVLIICAIVGGLIVIGVLAYVIKRGMRKDAMAR
jgi:hypothetical protein